MGGASSEGARRDHAVAVARSFGNRRRLKAAVETKKKELVGAFKNAGRTWRPAYRRAQQSLLLTADAGGSNGAFPDSP